MPRFQGALSCPMPSGALRVVRYLRAWSDPGRTSARTEVREVTFKVDGLDTPGTLYLPHGRGADPLPAWVVLHGVTVPGRRHEALIRFASTLAQTGAAVFTPEIPAWTRLDLDPARSLPTVMGAVLALEGNADVDVTRVGLVGFSFGAPQALVAAGEPDLAQRLRVVVGFGGYCDLRETLRYLFTGWTTWKGRDHYARPDPYGRWIVASNYLPRVPGLEESAPVADALRSLAVQAGQRRIASWDPQYDPMKERMAADLPERVRPLFRLVAPPASERAPREEGTALADRILEALRAEAPRMDPLPWLDRLTVPVHLIHGRHDALIPYTESLRMAEALAGSTACRVTVTRLFAHSQVEDRLGPLAHLREQVALARALSGVLGGV